MLTLHDSTIVINRRLRIRNSVISKASILIIAQLESIFLTLNKRTQLTKSILATTAASTTNAAQRQHTIVKTHTDKLVRRIGRAVPVLTRSILNAVLLHSLGLCGGTANLLGDEIGAKGSQLRQLEATLGAGRVLGQTGGIFEVVHRQSGQDGDDDVVVGEVGVDLLVEGEVVLVVVKGGVDGGVGGGDVLELETGEEFLEVADALGAAGGIAVAVVEVVCDVSSEANARSCGVLTLNVQRILETVPLLLGEEVTEIRHANESILVSANILHLKNIRMVQSKALRRMLLQPLNSMFEVQLRVVRDEVVRHTQIIVIIVVEAAIIRRQRIILLTTLRNRDQVERLRPVHQSLVGSGVEARSKEPQRPIDLRVDNARLARSAQRELGSLSAIGEGCAVGFLARRGVEEGAAVAVPEVDAVAEFSVCAGPGEQTYIVHDVGVGVEEFEGAREAVGRGFGEVGKFLGEGTCVADGEALGMALEGAHGFLGS